jgi:purine-binding chemotaxis protein CheW
MTLTTADAIETPPTDGDSIQIATFYLDSLLLGLQINQVQEINRQLEVTSVPHAPSFVKGVINLRGEVVTVVDLRQVLGLPSAEITDDCRNVIIHHRGELVGLLVDQIADILTIESREIDPPPSNVGSVEGKFFRGVHSTDDEIVVILDVDAALDTD